MTTQTETLKLVLEVLKLCDHTLRLADWGGDLAALKARETIKIVEEALAQPEQDTCKWCNGIGVVGNILDTNICPFCNGSGIEAQPEQEPVAFRVWDRMGGISFRRNKPFPSEYVEWDALYTTPPQRKPLTDEQIEACLHHVDQDGIGLFDFARAIEAAHGIKE